jgi:hypothetical protein
MISWVALALVLNAVWEVVQLPLYSLASDPSGLRIALYVGHCVAGDIMIATLLFLLAAALLRDVDWPRHRPWRGGAIVVAAGLGYTAFSEWRNIYVTGAWAYNELMPTVGGIGLAPLLQWLIVPALSIALMRRML